MGLTIIENSALIGGLLSRLSNGEHQQTFLDSFTVDTHDDTHKKRVLLDEITGLMEILAINSHLLQDNRHGIYFIRDSKHNESIIALFYHQHSSLNKSKAQYCPDQQNQSIIDKTQQYLNKCQNKLRTIYPNQDNPPIIPNLVIDDYFVVLGQQDVKILWEDYQQSFRNSRIACFFKAIIACIIYLLNPRPENLP